MTTPRKLDLLLINPASRGEVYQSLGRELAAVEPPLWAALLAGFPRRALDVEAVKVDRLEQQRREAAFLHRLRDDLPGEGDHLFRRQSQPVHAGIDLDVHGHRRAFESLRGAGEVQGEVERKE